MTEPQSPLENLTARIRQLLEGEAPAALIAEVQQALERFFAAFELVPRREFEAQLQALRDLEALVADLEGRVQDIEAER